MLRADYTTEERETFQQFRYHDPDPRIQRRFWQFARSGQTQSPHSLFAPSTI